MRVATGVVKTALGSCRIAISDRGVCLVSLPGRGSDASFRRQLRELWPEVELHQDARATSAATRQIAEYFTGERREFSLPLHLTGTAFQNRVWRACVRIPFGQTRSYGQLAGAAGRRGAARAVGAAMARNRLPILVPCHRVVGGDGSLTGFGGGLALKRKLLRLEAAEQAR